MDSANFLKLLGSTSRLDVRHAIAINTMPYDLFRHSYAVFEFENTLENSIFFKLFEILRYEIFFRNFISFKSALDSES